MSTRAYHEELRLQNFTAFRDASFKFVPGVNVLVGENGTGKTHVLKALYAWQSDAVRQGGWASQLGFSTQDPLPLIYQVRDEAELVRESDDPESRSSLSGKFGESLWARSLLPRPVAIPLRTTSLSQPVPEGTPRPVFIPAIDMMGHTKGFVQTYDEFAIDFDLTHRDIVSLLLSPERRIKPDTSHSLEVLLGEVLKGTLDVEGERFYLVTPQRRLAMPAVAEGLRKVATLLRLVQGGWLREGTALFWDEPEVNVNPILMDEVIGAILSLARSGVQVFLATHSYVILKELDLQASKEPDLLRYFALSPSESGTVVNPADDLDRLEPNPILAQYDSLLDRQLTRAIKRNRRGDRID